MIEIKNLKKSFGTREVLKGVNLNIVPNKVTVIFGFSGGGKSTIIKHIVRLLSSDSGTVLVDNEDITKVSIKRLYEIRKKIGFLFQSGALFDSMNVGDNVAFPLVEHTKLSKNKIDARVEELLEMVDLKPKDILKLFPDELSGGMRKRVGLARTLALNPKYILYDEPTSGLDPITSDIISKLIRKLQQELDTTSILISHDIDESFKSGDYFAMLSDGKIVEYQQKNEFINSQNKDVKKFLGINKTK
jgi:phospholipid/cholesterol/gamma-HCH transport system ATP-binding protein